MAVKSTSWLAALGLSRPELRAWAMFDFATSAVQTTIMVAVFPIYFTLVAGHGAPSGEAAQLWAISNSIGTALVAVLSPVLGAVADRKAAKKRLLAAFMSLGLAALVGMFFIGQGDLRLAASLFVLVAVAASGSFVFYESLLPHIASEREMDRVSTAGYALGYVGGGILLALNLLWIQKPEWFGLPYGSGLSSDQSTLPTRLSFLSVALWWLLFSLPLFRRVPEPPVAPALALPRQGAVVGEAFRELWRTFQDLARYRQALLFLVAFLIYNDGIGTIQRMSAAYGTEIGISQGSLITAMLIVQFVGVPFAFAFGSLAGRMGPKRAIFLGLAVYFVISVVGFFMRTALHFYLLALLVGMVQGGTQALSRSLFASMIPKHKSGEFFGFFSVFSKFAGIFGPLVFAAIIALTGSSRYGILSVILFFATGALLLSRVRVEEGRAQARQAEDELLLPYPEGHAPLPHS